MQRYINGRLTFTFTNFDSCTISGVASAVYLPSFYSPNRPKHPTAKAPPLGSETAARSLPDSLGTQRRPRPVTERGHSRPSPRLNQNYAPKTTRPSIPFDLIEKIRRKYAENTLKIRNEYVERYQILRNVEANGRLQTLPDGKYGSSVEAASAAAAGFLPVWTAL